MPEYRCSFCGKNQHQARKLIAGPRGVFICDECVALCQSIIGEDLEGRPRTEARPHQTSWLDRLRRMAVALPR